MRNIDQNRKRGSGDPGSSEHRTRQAGRAWRATARAGAAALLLAALGLGTLPAPVASAQQPRPAADRAGQGGRRGRLTASFMEAPETNGVAERAMRGGRPAWVENALARSLARLKQPTTAAGKREAAPEYALFRADQDDLGQVHVRLDQLQNGVPVYGGQLVVQLDTDAVLDVSGKVFEEARQVDTKPSLTPAQAIAAAMEALGYKGTFARKPTAKLVVLPNEDVVGKPAAILCFQVELLVEDGTKATARHQYFVDAQDGQIVRHFDSLAREGTGHGLYSGTVPLRTEVFNAFDSTFVMMDAERDQVTTDMGNQATADTGDLIIDSDDDWGDGTTGDRVSAAVDAHFGATLTFDYFLNVHGRLGIDNAGHPMVSRVHYGTNFDNASWNGQVMTYGDGDGVTSGPFTTIDIVGHELTHGLTEKTADLIYQNESGALNESFSDIFGTAIEFFSGINPDWRQGEDRVLSGIPGEVIRDLQDPTSCTYAPVLGGPRFAYPDHYSVRFMGAWDNGGVHINSSIQNKAFYLLAEGGTHPRSGVVVDGIGREAAERIFFRALTLKLFPTATFLNSRDATLTSAAELYGTASQEYVSTGRAWDAVGVFPIGTFPLYQKHSDGKIWQYTGTLNTGWQLLDSNPRTAAIVADGTQLYQLHDTGWIYRYAGTPNWELLDTNPRTAAIVADGGQLYQLHDTGWIYRSTGTPGGWERLDDNENTISIVADAGQLYQLHSDGGVWQYTGTPGIWELLDANSATVAIVAGGGNLYQRHDDGSIWQYTGSPFWELLDANPSTVAIVADGSQLYQRHDDGGVWQYTGAPGIWELLDANPDTVSIAADAGKLYQLHGSGRVWIYTGTPHIWHELDSNASTRAIAAAGDNLFQLHEDGTIWKYTNIPITGWREIDANPNTAAIAADGYRLYQLHNDGGIWRYTGTPGVWELLDANPATVSIAVAANNLFQLHRDGSIWQYTGSPFWRKLDHNPLTVAIVADGTQLYQLHSTGWIYRYVGTPQWERLDHNRNTVAIVADAGRLYQLHKDGGVWRYTGTPGIWTLLDANRRTVSIVADGGQLYQRHKDGAVWRYVGSPNWELLDANSATVEVVADAGKLFQRHSGGQVWVYTGTPGIWQQLDSNPNTVALASNVGRR